MLGWNQPQDWVISKTAAHPALVSEGDFVAAQAITAIPAPPMALPAPTLHTSAKPPTPDRPKTLYLRQDHLLERITLRLNQVQAQDQTTSLDPTELANYLRAQGITILCDTETCTLDTDRPTNRPDRS